MLLRPYRPSGRARPILAVYAVLLAVLAVLLAAAYSAIAVWVPIVGFVTIAACFGFSFAIGAAVNRAAHAAHCRSIWITRAVAVGVGGVAWLASWVFFVVFLLIPWESSPLELINPLMWLGVAFVVGSEGYYNVNGMTLAGAPLVGIWALEAVVFLVGPPWLVDVGGAPYCEDCDTWELGPQMLHAMDDAAQDWGGLLRQWDVAAFLEVGPPPPRSLAGATLLASHHCPTCPSSYVSLLKLTRTEEQKGVSTSVSELVPPHHIERPDLDLARALLAEGDAVSTA